MGVKFSKKTECLAERFPGRHQPDDNEFTAVYRRRSVTKSSRLAGRPTTVLQQKDESLSTSTRVTDHNIGASKSTVWRTLNKQLLYPFKHQKVQEILPGDYA